MKSIQARLTITFIGLMVALLVIVWGVNRWYLEDFYVNQKVESLMRAMIPSTGRSSGMKRRESALRRPWSGSWTVPETLWRAISKS